MNEIKGNKPIDVCIPIDATCERIEGCSEKAVTAVDFNIFGQDDRILVCADHYSEVLARVTNDLNERRAKFFPQS